MFYEMYVQPTDGPCSVQERGFNGEISWTDRDTAIEVAKAKRRRWRHTDLHFLVHEIVGEFSSYQTRRLVYATKEDPTL